MWTDTHTQDTSTGINVCGGTVAESKFSVPVEVVLPHTSDTLRIGFGSTIENGKRSIRIMCLMTVVR